MSPSANDNTAGKKIDIAEAERRLDTIIAEQAEADAIFIADHGATPEEADAFVQERRTKVWLPWRDGILADMRRMLSDPAAKSVELH